jgi:hypothetical protein
VQLTNRTVTQDAIVLGLHVRYLQFRNFSLPLIRFVTEGLLFPALSITNGARERDMLLVLVVAAPVVDDLVPGLTVWMESERIRGRGIPETSGAIPFGKSRTQSAGLANCRGDR